MSGARPAPSFVWISDADVNRLVPMPRAVAAVEAAFRAHATGSADNAKRSRAIGPGGILAITGPAVLPHIARMGFKAFSIGLPPFQSVPRAPPVFVLYDSEGGGLLALMEALALGFIRTGAATGVATDRMSRADSRVVGMFGAGNLGLTQLEAVASVRKLTEIRVHSRNAARCAQFCRTAGDRLGIRTVPAADPRNAVEGCDIVITATTSAEPVFDGAWLAPGTHINAVGANFANRREFDSAAIARCAIVAVDALDQARDECGDLCMAIAEGAWSWQRVVELGAIVNGQTAGRNHADEITLFESQGIALEDVAVADEAYRAFLIDAAGVRNAAPASAGP